MIYRIDSHQSTRLSHHKLQISIKYLTALQNCKQSYLSHQIDYCIILEEDDMPTEILMIKLVQLHWREEFGILILVGRSIIH